MIEFCSYIKTMLKETCKTLSFSGVQLYSSCIKQLPDTMLYRFSEKMAWLMYAKLMYTK